MRAKRPPRLAKPSPKAIMTQQIAGTASSRRKRRMRISTENG
jgi:hypothetical protein